MKKRTIITGIVVVVLALVVWWLWHKPQSTTSQYRTVAAERSTVKQDVAFTGNLDARESTSLGFEMGGSVQDILVKLGDTVTAGQPLVRLDDQLANLELAKAQADQDAAENQKKVAWQSAENDWQKTKAENGRLLEQKRQAVRSAKAELDQQRQVFEQTDQESGDSSTTDTALALVRTKETAYAAAQTALASATKSAETSNAAARGLADEAKAAYLATVQRSGTVAGLSSLEAGEQLAAVKLQKTVLTAPFNGVVTQQDADLGQYIAPGTAVVSVATVGDLDLKANVSETDAAKLAVGNSATVTFDAYGSDEQWSANVTSIAPAAKIIEGVPTFEVHLTLTNADTRFRPGLTANITVHAAEEDNVVAIPRRAIVTKGGKEFVQVLTDGQVHEVSITTGLLGTDGRIEITSGLNGGEQVLLDQSATPSPTP